MPLFSRFNLSIAALAAMLSLSGQAHAIAECKWESTAGPMEFATDLGSYYVPFNAPVGSKIGSLTLRNMGTTSAVLLCENDGSGLLTANITSPLSPAPGTFPEIDGKNVNGKVFQTSIPGVGLYMEFGGYLNGTVSNEFKGNDGGIGAVPFIGENREMMIPTNMRMQTLRIKYAALIKTGNIPAGPQFIANQNVMQGVVSDVGSAINLRINATVTQAQCTLRPDAVSANPVQLGSHDIAKFTGLNTTTNPVDFSITLNDCVDAPAGSVARAFMRLDGVSGSVPLDRDLGLFSLTTDSSASGIGIQVLRSDNTPLKLEEFIDMAAIIPGTMNFELRAQYYQTAPTVTPGTAKGALNFTIEYR